MGILINEENYIGSSVLKNKFMAKDDIKKKTQKNASWACLTNLSNINHHQSMIRMLSIGLQIISSRIIKHNQHELSSNILNMSTLIK